MHPDFQLRPHRGKFYVVHYDGEKRIRRSLGTDNPALARTRLGEYIRQVQSGQRLETATVGEIVEAYLNESKAVGVPIMRFQWKAPKETFQHLRPAHVTKDICRAYAIERGRAVKPGTIRKELGIVRNALSWAVKDKWIQGAPHIEMPAAPPARDIRLTRAEADRLLTECADAHLRLFVLVAIHTAARAGAILSLAWRQVDLERGRIDFGGEERQKRRAVVPVNAVLMPALQRAREAATSPWVIEYGGDRVKSVRKAFASAVSRSGLTGVTPHVLRHTAATWLAEGGVGMDEIAQYLGHTDSRITFKIYARFTPDYLARAAAVLAG